MDHFNESVKILKAYDSERIKPLSGALTDRSEDQRESFLHRLLAEAQVRATLAVAAELERHRMAGWGRPT